MIWQIKREKWEQLWKKYRFVLLILLGGVVLMLLPTSSDDAVQAAEVPRENFSLEATEQRMEEILSHIDGTGKLQLMLTLKSGTQLQLAEDTDRSVDGEELQMEPV